MAWNEPGKSDQQPEQGPPNLDEALRKLNQKLGALLGNKKSSSSSGRNGGTFGKSGRLGIILFVIALIITWGLLGIFIVSPAEQAVILKFGQYQRTVSSGPHWIPRFIESQTTLNVQKISSYNYSSQMLTLDQNIVDVAIAVQYRIKNAENYLYNVAYPTISLQQATASALRQVIGGTTLDEALTTGRAKVRQQVEEQLNKILARYEAGIVITDVALQPARAPEQVKDAFDDAIKAQEDEQRYKNKAEAYAMEVVPIAQGKANRIIAESKAYKEQVVLDAKANIARFKAVLPIYRNAPQVTRDRMYLTALEQILQNNPKIFIDSKTQDHNLLYLPVDKLLSSLSSKVNKTVADNDRENQYSAQTGNTITQRSTSSPANQVTTINRSNSSIRPERFSITNRDN